MLEIQIVSTLRCRWTASETVTVEATAVTVQSDSSEVSDLISGKQVSKLAINGRNIVALATLTPGASADLPDFNLPISVGSSTGVSFNGKRPEHNIWMIDGGENYDRGCGGCMTVMPSVDALAEFKTYTANSSADFGIGSGGTMNMALKSGTRSFHGSAYEYFRNDAMDANNYFANLNGSPKPELRYNIFGFNIGGPVFIPKLYNTDKSKTFFFVNKEWRKIVQGNQVFAPAIPQSERMVNSAHRSPSRTPAILLSEQNLRLWASLPGRRSRITQFPNR